MKKFFILLAICLSGVSYVNCIHAEGNKTNETTRQDIQIRDAIIPAKPDQVRSVLPFVTAWVDYAAGNIEVSINRCVGVASVVITDLAGQTVCTASVDTKFSAIVKLSVPAAGIYHITVSGDEYLGEGDFTIE